MTALPLWTLLPTFVALAGTIVFLVLARRDKWTDPSITATQPEAQAKAEQTSTGDFKSRLKQFASERRWELLLAGVVLGVALYVIIFAPVQMTGKVSIDPLQPGRPFFFLHWQRNTLDIFYYEAASLSNLLTGLLALALMVVAALRRSRQALLTALLWSLLSTAAAAQWCLGREQEMLLGIALYIIAALGFLAWGLLTRRQIAPTLDQPIRIGRNLEIALVLTVMALAAFGRLFELHTIPYGIEGDEAKWTGEVVWLGIRGLPDLSGLYHRDALPTSFYMETPFHKLLGPSIFAARLEVALFSILATFVFYLLMRRIANIPLALLASWLLSASIFDISASRLANVESHVKLWPILTLALLAWAIQKRQWPAFAISGIAMALGLLTYDTVWPLLIVAVIIAIVEVARHESDLADKVRNVTALLAPAFLALPFLLPYFASRISYYEFGAKGWGAGLSTFWGHFTDVLTSWFMYTHTDFLYNRSGPLVNAFLLPWIVLGFVVAVTTIRKRVSYWALIWFLLFIFPVPIAAHSPLGRVYYPGLPAAYIFAAIGLFLFARDSLRTLGKYFQPFFFVIALVVLIWLPLMNLYIYFNETGDPMDRQVRREIGEMAGAAASMDTLIVLPSVPHGDEPLNNEYQMVELYMLNKIPSNQIENSYKNVALDALLPALPYGLTTRPNLQIILDKTTAADREKRDELAAALQRCYPEGKMFEGYFFNRFSLPATALIHPACISSTLSLKEDSQSQLSWSLAQSTATGLMLACEVQSVDHIWLEAEALPPPPGWQPETAFATDWSGSGFLLDNYNSAPIVYNFDSKTDKQVYVWARTYKRVVDDSYLELNLNGKASKISQATIDQTNQWIWERVGPFEATTGSNTLTISRIYKSDPNTFMAIFIDTLVITPSETFKPDQNHYLPLPVQHFRFATEQSSGQVAIDFAPGTYRCHAEVDSKQNLVDNFGHSPVESNTILIEVKP